MLWNTHCLCDMFLVKQMMLTIILVCVYSSCDKQLFMEEQQLYLNSNLFTYRLMRSFHQNSNTRVTRTATSYNFPW